MKSIRGRITGTNRETGIGDIVRLGMKPLIIAYFVTGISRARNALNHLSQSLGLSVTPVQSWDTDGLATETYNAEDGHYPYRTAFEIAGTPQALLSVMDSRYCVDSHLPLDVRIPVKAQGSGAEKVKYRAPLYTPPQGRIGIAVIGMHRADGETTPIKAIEYSADSEKTIDGRLDGDGFEGAHIPNYCI